jgi:hypothetical protein
MPPLNNSRLPRDIEDLLFGEQQERTEHMTGVLDSTRGSATHQGETASTDANPIFFTETPEGAILRGDMRRARPLTDEEAEAIRRSTIGAFSWRTFAEGERDRAEAVDFKKYPKEEDLEI